MVSEAIDAAIRERVIEPLLAGMKEEGAPFRGVLFAGLMIVDGEPKVLEFNVRFGDPETEVLLPRLRSDLLPLLLGAAEGDLRGVELEWGAPASACVVLASGGYPGRYQRGLPIEGVEEAEAVPGAHLCFAGVERDEAGRWVTAGGRVLAACAVGQSVAEAAERAYEAADKVRFEGKQLRRDIGWQAR
jgi:phosphoribosylamine--glycine ligase